MPRYHQAPLKKDKPVWPILVVILIIYLALSHLDYLDMMETECARQDLTYNPSTDTCQKGQ